MTFFSQVSKISDVGRVGAALVACLLLPSGCETGTRSVAGDPRDKIVATYGEPHARQTSHNIEVWQYCTPRSGGEALDHLHLLWLMDGLVIRESRHDFDLDRCQRLYVVDLGSPPQPG
ncbi:MAG TPA: hypothetical protein VK035_01205 [Kiloniellales bacterium]|nr:hypothetical protein [Kiloniellales bacterium]